MLGGHKEKANGDEPWRDDRRKRTNMVLVSSVSARCLPCLPLLLVTPVPSPTFATKDPL